MVLWLVWFVEEHENVASIPALPMRVFSPRIEGGRKTQQSQQYKIAQCQRTRIESKNNLSCDAWGDRRQMKTVSRWPRRCSSVCTVLQRSQSGEALLTWVRIPAPQDKVLGKNSTEKWQSRVKKSNLLFQMKKWVRAGVFIVFFGWLCSSLAVVNKIEIGLDQVSCKDCGFWGRIAKWIAFLLLAQQPQVRFLAFPICFKRKNDVAYIYRQRTA